MLKVRKLVRPS
uniref:Uncharacterized protein n=1 Tax=Arundo donax TaxID=35708 RepID=A0A0A8YKB2_ARUDO